MKSPEINNLSNNPIIGSVFNDLEESVIICGPDQVVRYANEAAYALLNKGKGELVGKPVKEVISSLPSIETFLRNNNNCKSSFANKVHLSCDKNQCLAEIKVNRFEIDEGQKGFSIILKDITEKEGFTAELQRSEKKYKALFQNALEGIIVMDDSSAIIDVNPTACQVYGMSRERMTSLKIHDLFPHKSKEEAGEIWHSYITEGFLAGLYKYALPSGEVKYINFKAKSNFISGYHIGVFSDVTEQRKIEAALRNSEAQLKSFFDNTSQRIFLIDLDLKIILANKVAKEVVRKNLGFDVQKGDSILKIVHQDSDFYKELSSFFERVVAGEHVSFESQPYPDHSNYWIEVTIYPVFDNKRITSICITINDISLRKKAELNLAESEARFRSLVQHSNDVIAVISNNNMIEYTSSSINKVLGYNDHDLTGQNLLDLVYKDDINPLKELLESVTEDLDGSVSHEFRIRHAEGYYLYLETVFNNQSDNPFINGVLMSARDITERKFQEESLLLLERAIDSSENGIIITDPNQPDNPIIYANKAFETMTGYDYLDIIGKNCRFLQGKDNQQSGIRKIRKALNEKTGVSVLIRNYKKDGSLFWNELTISPVFSRENKLTNFIGVLNDVTERKVVEDTFHEIAQGIANAPEKNFFKALANHLRHFLHLDLVFIAEVDNNVVYPKAFLKDGKLVKEQNLKTQGTPWGKVIKKKKVFFSSQVNKEFPECKDLLDGFSKFLGVPLVASDGRCIGVIAVASRGGMENQALSEALINLFSIRTSAELEREKYLVTLQKSESKFRMLAENSPDLIFIFNANNKKVEYFNKKNIFGYKDFEIKEAKKWIAIHHPDDIRDVARQWGDIMEGKPVPETIADYRILRKDGGYEWATTKVTAIEKEGDLPSRFLVNLSVITERKNAEEALKKGEDKLTALIENTNDILFSVDRSLQLTTMNTAYKDFVRQHFKKSVKVGDNVADILEDKSLNDHWVALMSRAIEGERFNQEFNLNVIDKEESFDASFNPIYSDNNEITGVSVFVRDITSRKNAELDIIRTNFELDSFVYRASHDLRAPLRSVLGLLNLMKVEKSAELRDNYVSLANKSILKLDTFISDLTNFSRNSRLEVTPSKIDFDGILDDATERLRFMENADKISIHKNLQIGEDFYSDPTRISIIIQNLVSNAIKYQNEYVEKRYCEVTVETSEKMAKIQIKDNGKGIRQEYISKIFNMFFRASQDSYGSGLGLYITKQVVEKLEGSIGVESTVGQGTTFTIIIPNLYNKVKG